MRYYETLYIINPNYEQERHEKILGEVKGEIDREDVTVINHRTWGKKRLAYPIQKHKYGTYMLLQFETGSIEVLKDFDTFMKLNRGVIRHQTVRLDTRPDVYEEEIPEVKTKEASISKGDAAEKPAETSNEAESKAQEEVSEPAVEEESAENTEPEASESDEADEEKTTE